MKWFILFAYRPESIDRKLFFDELNKTLSKASKDYEYLVVAGDLNIELRPQHNTDRHNLLSELCGTFNLKNISGTEMLLNNTKNNPCNFFTA